MQIPWGSFWQKSRKPLKTGWRITAGLIAVYVGAIEPREGARGISTEKATGLSATAGWEPVSLWRQTSVSRLAEGVVGGVPGGMPADEKGSVEMASVDALPAPPPPPPKSAPDDRKMIRNGAMDLIVKSPRDTSEKIRHLAQQFGGFLVSSETSGGEDASTASLIIRVPAARFEDARAEIRKLGLHVESEKLEVHDKLNEVRGEIEQQQAEFDALSKQVETVALTISLRAEAEAKVFGLNWRPLYQVKLAAREGLDSVGDYAASMASFLFYLPKVVLWLATILIGAAVGWRMLRWAGKALFVATAK